MSPFEEERLRCEDFIRYCGITPQHNFFRVVKGSAPLIYGLFQAWDYRLSGVLTTPYLLVFTPDEVIVKNDRKKLVPENYDYGLDRIAKEDFKDFMVKDMAIISRCCISFRYKDWRHFFYLDPYGGYGLSELRYSETNFRLLLENGFYGLLKD